MTATIKICGLRDYNAIKMSVDSGAKYLGFVCDYFDSGKARNRISPFFKNVQFFKVQKSPKKPHNDLCLPPWWGEIYPHQHNLNPKLFEITWLVEK